MMKHDKRPHTLQSFNVEIPKKSKLHGATAGFTMVELLLYMGLFVGFITMLGGLFASTLETQADATATSHTDQDSWYIFNRLQYDLYRADTIVIPAENGNTTANLVLEIDGAEITYSLVNNRLTITENTNSIPLVTNQVTVENLSFQRLGNNDGIASITAHMQLRNAVSDQIKDVSFTVGKR